MTWKCIVCGHESPDGYGECEGCMQKDIERLTTEVSELKEQLLGVGSAHLEAHIKRLEERYTGVMKTLDASVTETKKWQNRCESLANFNPDWDMLEATQQSLREHMANEKKLTAEVQRKDETLRAALDRIRCEGPPDPALEDWLSSALEPVSGKREPCNSFCPTTLHPYCARCKCDEAAHSDDSSPEPCDHEYGLPQHSGSVGSVWTCNKCQHRRFSEPVEKGPR